MTLSCKKILILLAVTINSDKIFSQTSPQQYTGDESKCPYLHPASNTPTAKDNTTVVDDFESTLKWNNMQSGSLNANIEICDTAKVGKKGVKISFSGTASKGSWTMLQCKISNPVDKTKIVFWAKAPKKTKVKLTAYQGANHDSMEIFSKTVFIGTEWKKYEISFAEMTELVFSHLQQEGKPASEKLNISQINAIGFAEADLPATFFIDQIEIH